MKVLIIGSKGFIGSHLLQSFDFATEVWGCDVVTDHESTRYIQISAVNADFHEVFSSQPFDVCINCSGAASVPASLKEPLKDYELNTANVFRMLDAIRKYTPACKFINLSSAAVYGNPAKLPVAESFPVQPVSPYGIHKRQAEEICSSFYNFWQVGTCSLRIFSAYGNGLTKQLFWDLYQKSLTGNVIDLFGTGAETRDFIHVDDIARAIMQVIQKASFKGEYINIANGSQWMIKDVAAILFDALGWQGSIRFKGINRTGDPLNWQADISLLQAMGYQQRISMEQGLLNYAQWLRERR